MPRSYKPRAVVEPHNTGRKTQTPAAPTGMPYGEHQRLIEDQKALAMPSSSLQPGAPPAVAPGSAPPPAAPSSGGAPAAPQGALAAMLGMDPARAPVPLGAPTQRPEEPITAGLAPVPAPAAPDPLLKLRALYQAWPNADVADLLTHLEG